MAAVVPTLSAIYVASSYLVEFAERNHAKRVYDRVSARMDARREALEESRRSGLDLKTYDKERSAINALRMRLLELNGVDPWLGTYKASEQKAGPQGVSAVEMRRQWASLLGAMLGVILLALSTASGS